MTDGWVPDKPASADGWVPDKPTGLQPLASHTPGGQKFKAPLSMRIKDALPSRKTVAKYARPVLEGIGMGAGAIGGAVVGGGTGGVTLPVVGAIPGAVAGGVAGSSLGYATGSTLADMIEGPEANQVRLPSTPDSLEMPKYRNRTIGEEAGSQVNKLITGANMEMLGQVGAKAAGAVVNKIAGAKLKGIPLSDKRAQYKAAQEFAASQEPSAASTEANKLRQTETESLLNRLGTTATPTPGQAAGNHRSAALEQSMAAKDPEFAEALLYNDASLRQSATDKLTGALGRGQELPRTPPRDVTGANIVKAIETAKAPVQTAERAAWAEVPEYSMPANNFTEAGRKIVSEPMPRGTKKAVRDIMTYAKDVPHTVEGLQSIERSIKSEISKATRAGDKETARALGQLRDAVQADFTAIGEAADRGDIALSGGKVIMPSRIQADIAAIDNQIAAAQTSPVSIKEQNAHLAKYLAGKGETVMQNTGVSDEMYGKSLADRLKYLEGKGKAGDYAPPTSGKPADTEALVTRRAALQATLDAAEPAENVATAYSAAKRYSKEEKFDRFYRGAVKDVLASGEQVTGRQITNEQVPARFFTRQGSKDLSISLMPPKGMINPETGEAFNLPERLAAGKQAAAEQMIPHVTEQLISKTVDANTGVMNVPRAMAYLRQNADVLHELGLTNSVRQVIKGQVPRAIEAELEAKGVDVVGNPAMTALQAGKMIRRMGPAISKLYGEPAMTALRDYGQMMEILGRNKNVSYAKGSTTVEKMGGDMVTNLAEKGAGLAAVVGGHGWVFSAAKNLVKGMFEGSLRIQRQEINKLLQEALMNPAAAEALMKVAKAKPADVSAVATKYLTPFMRQLQIGSNGKRGVSGVGTNVGAGVSTAGAGLLGGLNLVTGGGK